MKEAEAVRVLHIEDDALEQRAFLRLVHEKSLAWNVVTAESLAVARTELKTRPFDVIVADYHLPDGQSTELFQEVPALPFVLVTGTLEEQLAIRTLERGADDYLIKDQESRYLEALPLAVEKTLHRKEIRDRERRVTEQLELLIEGVKDYAIYMLDAEGRVSTWNKGAERIKGYKAEEIIGKDFCCFFTPEDVASGTPQTELRIAKDNGSYSEEGWRVRKDGARFWASVTVSALYDEPGELRGFVEVTRDITEQRRADEVLRESEKHYRTLFNAIDEGFCIIEVIFDEHGKAIDYRFIEINPSFEQQTGLIDAQGKRMRELAPKLEEYWFEVYGKIASTGQPARFQHHAEQLHRSYDVYAFRFGEPEKRQVGVLFNDITERKLAEEARERLLTAEQEARAAAEAANRGKDEFVALVAHELRNPLNAIKAGVGVMRRLSSGNEGDERVIDVVERNVDLQARMVNDLLDLSRLQRGKLALHRAAMRLDKTVSSAVQSLTREAAEAGITLTVNAQPDLWVLGDHDRLQQVVTNLITNAIKFNRPSGTVTVSVSRTNGSAVISVEDSGIGIEQALLDRLFDLFRQGEVAGQQKPGLGLGLALVKELVEQHEGRVRAESGGAGTGSRFMVELPTIKTPDAIFEERDGYRSPSPTLAPQSDLPHVLVVEDNKDTLLMLAEDLQGRGYRVQKAASGEEALEVLSRMKPDVILSDIRMPGIDGYEMLRRAKTLPGLAGVPAFAVTAYGQEEDVREAIAAGFIGHFTKPLNVTALEQRMRELIQGPAVHDMK